MNTAASDRDRRQRDAYLHEDDMTQSPRSRLPVKSPARPSTGAMDGIGGMTVAYSPRGLGSRDELEIDVDTARSHPADGTTLSASSPPHGHDYAKKLQELRNAMDLLKTPPALKKEPLQDRPVLTSPSIISHSHGPNVRNAHSPVNLFSPASPRHETTPLTRSWSIEHLATNPAASSVRRMSSFIAAGSSSASGSDSDDEERVAEMNAIMSRIDQSEASLASQSTDPLDTFISAYGDDGSDRQLDSRLDSRLDARTTPSLSRRAEHPSSPLSTPVRATASPNSSPYISAEELRCRLEATREAFQRSLQENAQRKPAVTLLPAEEFSFAQRPRPSSSTLRVPVTFDDDDDEESERTFESDLTTDSLRQTTAQLEHIRREIELMSGSVGNQPAALNADAPRKSRAVMLFMMLVVVVVVPIVLALAMAKKHVSLFSADWTADSILQYCEDALNFWLQDTDVNGAQRMMPL